MKLRCPKFLRRPKPGAMTDVPGETAMIVGKPKFEVGDKVAVSDSLVPVCGEVTYVDPFGKYDVLFGDRREKTYDERRLKAPDNRELMYFWRERAKATEKRAAEDERLAARRFAALSGDCRVLLGWLDGTQDADAARAFLRIEGTVFPSMIEGGAATDDCDEKRAD